MQLRGKSLRRAPRPMERHRESVRLVANQLNQVQNRRAAVQPDRFILRPQNLERLLYRARRRLENPEPPMEAVSRISGRQIHESFLLAALRRMDLDAPVSLLR